MPGMSGLEFCVAFPALPRGGYGYFILLTSKSEKGEAAHGLDAGADDFLAKPLEAQELFARIAAGERILRMEREPNEKNRLIGETLAEVQTLQQSLVRCCRQASGAASASLLLRPNGHVGGDPVGFFPIPEGKLALFAIDVSPHGVSSSIMTARLAGVSLAGAPEQNIPLGSDGGTGRKARPPEEVAEAPNRRCCRISRQTSI